MVFEDQPPPSEKKRKKKIWRGRWKKENQSEIGRMRTFQRLRHSWTERGLGPVKEMETAWMQIKPPLIPANIVLAIIAGLTRKEWSHSLSLGQEEVRGGILFSDHLGGLVHLGACLVPFKRHRPWQQRVLSAYLTVKACEKEERSWIGGGRKGAWQ